MKKSAAFDNDYLRTSSAALSFEPGWGELKMRAEIGTARYPYSFVQSSPFYFNDKAEHHQHALFQEHALRFLMKIRRAYETGTTTQLFSRRSKNLLEYQFYFGPSTDPHSPYDWEPRLFYPEYTMSAHGGMRGRCQTFTATPSDFTDRFTTCVLLLLVHIRYEADNPRKGLN